MNCRLPCTQPLRLSICISTYNRPGLICGTLDSILNQLTEACEVVILDASLNDETQHALERYAAVKNSIRYIRQGYNNGLDRDFDRAVELAGGDYCWLMSDDDCVKPGAISELLKVIRIGYSLIIVNAEARDESMSTVLLDKAVDAEVDREYESSDLDELFKECSGVIGYIGCIVVCRKLWLERDREAFYGCSYIHVGVIFQRQLPGKSLAIAKPMVSVRIGNQTWINRHFVVAIVNWWTLVHRLAISDDTKRKVCGESPAKNYGGMLISRAMGSYSLHEYRTFVRPHAITGRARIIPLLISVFPGRFANALMLTYYGLSRRRDRQVFLKYLRKSRCYAFGW